MARVLVTGGAGFIGSHLVDRLVAAGHAVTVIDSLEPQVHRVPPTYLNASARYRFSRLSCPRLDWPTLLDGVELVYHLASKVGPNQSMTEIADYVCCNIGDSGTLLQALLRHGGSVRRLVLAGSMGPYGEGLYQCTRCGRRFSPSGARTSFDPTCPDDGGAAHPLALDEETPQLDISFYGLSKHVQEQLFELFARDRQLELVILRFFSVYGPRQALGNPYGGPVPIWIDAAQHGRPLLVHEDGQQTRDFIHVADIAEINLRAGILPLATPRLTINCGTGHSTPVISLAQQIRQHFGHRSELVITGQLRPGDLRHSRADNTRLRQALGITQFVPIHEGLDRLLDEHGLRA